MLEDRFVFLGVGYCTQYTFLTYIFIIYSCADKHWGSVPLLSCILASNLIKKDFLFWWEIDYKDIIHALKIDPLKEHI